ncbi:MAG: hypothetical protein AB8U25_00070 [Rickettsiales endosymbiont of Dermacentor nuttalli]
MSDKGDKTTFNKQTHEEYSQNIRGNNHINDINAENNNKQITEMSEIEIIADEMIRKVLTDTYKIQSATKFYKDALSRNTVLLNNKPLSMEDQEAKQLVIKIANEKDNRIKQDAENKIKEVKDNIDKARLAMVNGNYTLAENYLANAINLVMSNSILKGSALETRIQVVRNEMVEVQNGYMSVQPQSQINLDFNSNTQLLTQVELEKHLNYLGNKLDDYHKSYYNDTDYRKRIYAIHKKIDNKNSLDNKEAQEYLEHIFEHDNVYRKEQMNVLSAGINAYNELQKIRSLTENEQKELKHFTSRFSRIQTDFQVSAKFSEWLAPKIDNIKDFYITKENVLNNSNNSEYLEKLISTIEKVKNKKAEKSEATLHGHTNNKTKNEVLKEKLYVLRKKTQTYFESIDVIPEKLDKKKLRKVESHGRLTPPNTTGIKKIGQQHNNK